MLSSDSLTLIPETHDFMLCIYFRSTIIREEIIFRLDEIIFQIENKKKIY
jgi:hypothetical protein